MPPIDVKVDSKKISAAIDAAPKKMGIALLRALKRGTKAGATKANRVVSKDMGIKVSDVRARIRLESPTARTLTGSLHASLKRIPLIKFGARGKEPSRGRGRGVSYRGKGGRARHPHAFITTMPGGHRGVFARKGPGRLPIKELYGPSIGRVFEEHRAEIMKRGEEVVMAEMDRQIQRMFGEVKEW